MAKYLVLIYGDEAVWQAASEQWNEQNGQAHAAFHAAAGPALLGGGELTPSGSAICVRGSASGRRKTTDGPFVETKEAIGGYYLLEASDDAAALALAQLIPEASAPTSGVEIRRVVS